MSDTQPKRKTNQPHNYNSHVVYKLVTEAPIASSAHAMSTLATCLKRTNGRPLRRWRTRHDMARWAGFTQQSYRALYKHWMYLLTWKSCNATMFSCFSSFEKKTRTRQFHVYLTGKKKKKKVLISDLTFNILISFPSRVCDFARFFLLMHFTATSQSCFYSHTQKATIIQLVTSDRLMFKAGRVWLFFCVCRHAWTCVKYTVDG